MTDHPKTDAPQVIMLPPILVLHHISAGLVLNWLAGAQFGHSWGWLGLVFLAAGYAVTSWAMKLFAKAGTNIRPDMPSLAIVTSGPYKYSRNPMYLGFMLAFTGLAMLADAPVMLLMLAPLWYILDRHVIQPEEKYLTEKFCSVYTDYKNQVRRWV